MCKGKGVRKNEKTDFDTRKEKAGRESRMGSGKGMKERKIKYKV